MIVVIILMAISNNINATEIVVLTIYLVLEAISKWKFILIALLIALSPIVCTLVCVYMCCCAPSQEVTVLNLSHIKATAEHVVKCDG